MYKDLLDQGYDPLDLDDKFYREICTPYKSENGTDVLLDEREKYIYSTIESEMSCPDGLYNVIIFIICQIYKV